MKIAYITIKDPFNYKSWSGLNYNIYKCLKFTGHQITCIGPLNERLKIYYVLKRFIFDLFSIKFDADRTINLSKDYCRQVQHKLNNKNYDLIFTTDTNTVSFLDTDIPILIWTDTTFQSWYNHYFFNKNISKITLKEGNYCEQKTLSNAKKIILTSKWAAKETIKYYKNIKKKIKILPFGSNLEVMPTLSKIKKKKFDNKTCRLVSVGVDWERKGFDRIINICQKIKKKGISVFLTIIGPSKIKKENLPQWVKIHKFLDKNKLESHHQISRIFFKSNFHILMSKSEACGVVFAEANSHGLFNVTTDVGGIKGMVKNNISGKMFKKNFSDDKIADYIFNLYKNKNKYRKISISSRKYYEQSLNWKKISKKLNKILKEAN